MPSSRSTNRSGQWSVHRPSPVHRSWSIHTLITPGSSCAGGRASAPGLTLDDPAAGDARSALAGAERSRLGDVVVLVGVDDDRALVVVEQRLGDVVGEREVRRGRVQPALPIVVGDEVGHIAGVMVGMLAARVLAVWRAVRVEVAAGTAEGDPVGWGAQADGVDVGAVQAGRQTRHLDVDVHDTTGVLGQGGEAGDAARPLDRGAGVDRAVVGSCLRGDQRCPAGDGEPGGGGEDARGNGLHVGSSQGARWRPTVWSVVNQSRRARLTVHARRRFRQVTAVISRMSFTSAINPSTAMLNQTPRAIHVNAAGGGFPSARHASRAGTQPISTSNAMPSRMSVSGNSTARMPATIHRARPWRANDPSRSRRSTAHAMATPKRNGRATNNAIANHVGVSARKSIPSAWISIEPTTAPHASPTVTYRNHW